MTLYDNTDHNALAALERLIVENDDLLTLESLIGKFNIFDALSIARHEIRHSNFLAFILDPSESHGQSDLFLKALLMDMLKSAPPNLRPLSPIELDGADLRGVEVRREWKNIDLLIACQSPAFVIIIENKIYSGEHSDQLRRYQQTARDCYPNMRPLFVFLTPDGSEASEDSWIPYSYGSIHRVLSRVRTTYENAIGDDVLVFLDHYLSLIGSRFMNDAKIDELCQRIYKNHRQALQLIYERVGTPSSGMIADVESIICNDDRWHVFYRSVSSVDFIPKDWIKWMPPLGLDSKDEPQSWFVLRFDVSRTQLTFFIEVRRMNDAAKRRAIIDMLLTDGAKYGLNRQTRKITDSYTRVSGREKLLTWEEEEVPEAATLEKAVRTKLDTLHANLASLPTALAAVLGIRLNK